MEAAGIEPALGALRAALPRGSPSIAPGPLLIIPAIGLPGEPAGEGPAEIRPRLLLDRQQDQLSTGPSPAFRMNQQPVLMLPLS